MYIPAHFSFSEQAEIVAFMQRYSFATIVSQVDASLSDGEGPEMRPFATHLPFVVEAEGEQIRLLAHFAKANPQWKNLEGQTVLVIFSEPHAYVSPSLYEKEQNVPTWNYIAVHAYGQAKLLSDEAEAFKLLEKQMQAFEKEYFEQWARLSQDYKNAMVKGIVAFEILVEKLEAKWKLSQNKKPQEQVNIMAHLSASDDGVAKEIGAMMEKYYQK